MLAILFPVAEELVIYLIVTSTEARMHRMVHVICTLWVTCKKYRFMLVTCCVSVKQPKSIIYFEIPQFALTKYRLHSVRYYDDIKRILISCLYESDFPAPKIEESVNIQQSSQEFLLSLIFRLSVFMIKNNKILL